MKTNTTRTLLAAAVSMLAASQAAHAVPINGLFIDDARCDAVPTQSLSHELGNSAMFPINEGLSIQTAPSPFTVCVPDDGVQNDWIVRITNVSGVAWTNLFFVSNLGGTVGNADGNMIDTVNAPGVTTDAFRIDGTVTLGLNNNLLGENGIVNEILEPGETWQFNVSNFVGPNGGSPPLFFNSPGLFAGSAPFNAAIPDSASIVATPVPEPTTVAALGLAAAALLMRRRRRA